LQNRAGAIRKSVKKLILYLGLLGFFAHDGFAQDFKTQSPELSDLVGRVFLTLSKDYVVSGQNFDGPVLLVNARLGRIEVPNGMSYDSGTRFETEYVPTDSGLVLRFYGPYSFGRVQKAWGTRHDKEKKTFEVLITLSKEEFIGVVGRYGASFPLQTVDGLLALRKEREAAK
jgi:hypothetical protein